MINAAVSNLAEVRYEGPVNNVTKKTENYREKPGDSRRTKDQLERGNIG